MLAKNAGYNGNYIVVECSKSEIQATLNRFSIYERKVHAPKSIGLCNWNNHVLILFEFVKELKE